MRGSLGFLKNTTHVPHLLFCFCFCLFLFLVLLNITWPEIDRNLDGIQYNFFFFFLRKSVSRTTLLRTRISIIANNVRHLFLYSFAIHISSLRKGLFTSGGHSLLRLFVSYYWLLRFMSSGSKAFIRYVVFKKFLPVEGFYFQTLTSVFWRAKFFILTKSNVSVCCFKVLDFGLICPAFPMRILGRMGWGRLFVWADVWGSGDDWILLLPLLVI